MKKLLFILFLFFGMSGYAQFQKPTGVTSVPTYSFFKNRADSTVTIYMGSVDLYNTLLSKFDSLKVKGYATNFKLLSYKQIKDSTNRITGYATLWKLTHKLDSILGLAKLRNDSTALSGYFTNYDALGKLSLDQTTPQAVVNGSPIMEGVQFDVTPSTTNIAEGLMRWNSTDGTLDLGMSGGDITMQVGQEMFTKVRNDQGATLNDGQVVYISGRTGIYPDVKLGRSDVESTSHVIGVVTHTIPNTGDKFGYVTTVGYIRGLKTNYSGAGVWGTTWVTGDVLYVSKSTAGQLTNVEPTAPHHSDVVGTVAVVHISQGSLLITINHHKTLEELTDVNGTALTATGQIPVWNNTSKYFDFDYNIANYRLKSDTVNSTGTATVSMLNKLSYLPNDTWVKGYDYAGNLSNLYKLSKDNLLTFGHKLNVQSLYTVADAGKVTIASMPNLRAASGDTLQYNIELGKVSMLKMRGVADGSGGLSDTTVIIPKLRLTRNAVNGYYLKVVDNLGTIKPRPIEATYQGTWNATTNTPTLADGTGTASFFYRCVVAGTVNLGSGNITFAVGDDVYYSGTVWQRIPAVSYTLQPATKTVLGGVKLDSTSVKYNGSGQIYVKNDYVENATHSGDASGSTALTLATVNANVGTYQGLTVNAKGLVTAAANQNYLANTLANGNIFVGNASNIATGVTPSGDLAISNTGVVGVNKTRLNVRNETGTTIASTKAVYISGFNNLPLITLATNVTELTHNVIGVTIAPITNQANGFIATTGQFDAETNGWTVGTELYLSTAGTLTATAPTSGSMRHVAIVTVRANYPVGKLLMYTYPEENYLAGGSGVDAILRTGDGAGANKFSFRNYANTEVASITSLGDYSGRKYTSTVATGTAPYSATSTTLNTNLNADLLDGYHSGTFKFANDTTASTGYLPIWRASTGQGFRLLNDQWLQSYDYAGNLFNLIKVSKDNLVTVPNLQLSALKFVQNSGLTTIADMPLSTDAVTGDYYGFKLSIGGVQALRIAGKWTGTAIDTIKVTAPVFEMTTGASINKIAMSEDSRGKIKWSDTKYLFSLVANRILYASATNEMSQLPLGTAGQLMQSGGVNTPTWTTPTYPNSATSGKVLIGDGTNIVLSTPTFPNASATFGKVIKSDGTNWVASTETYAAPSTSGNVMVSNGTNWTSSTKNLDWDKWAQWDGGSTGLTAATGRTSLGGTTIGQSIFTLGNPSAITFLRLNADNSATALSASDFRTAIGAGTSSTVGTVTSVAALTLGTTGTDLSSSVATGTTTPVITLNVPTASATNRGALSAVDWLTFNGKQAAGSYLTAESDPVYSAWNKSTGISITKSQVSDFGTYEAPLTFTTGLNRTGNTIISTITQYTHPTGNGNLHVPANTTATDAGKVLMASYNAGVISWQYAQPSGAGIAVSTGTDWGSSLTYGTSNSANAVVQRDASGNVSLVGDFCVSSDIRLKKNIKQIDWTKLNKLDQIDWIQYSKKDEPDLVVRYGVKAQELQKILPQFVYTAQDTAKTLSVDYNSLLIAKMLQMEGIIKDLEKRIEKLENHNKWKEKQINLQ